MSKRNSKPEWHEPVEAVIVEMDDSIDDTIEVGEVVLVDGPLDPVPFSAGPRDITDYNPPRHSAGPMPDFETAGKITDKVTDAAQNVADKAQDAGRKVQDKVQDVTQKVQDAAQGVAGKAQDAAKDAAQGVAGKAQDVTRKVAEGASNAKAAAGGALEAVKTTAGDAVETAKTAGTTAKSVLGGAAGKIGTVSASGAKTIGSTLWDIAQRNPLQAIFFIASLVWLVRNNKATASQTPVSLPEVGEKVGSVAGQVQVAAVNLSNQLGEQAQRSAGWFQQTLQTNPLALGAMAIVAGAAIGLAVPETAQEHQLMGETRDKLAGQVQQTAQDLTQKVTAVAQTAAHEAIETAKEEAKNQGLAPQ